VADLVKILEAAVQVARWLEKEGIPHFFIGGIALQYWGEPRLTRDVDVTVLVAGEKLDAFLEKVTKAFKPRLPDASDFARRHRVLLIETESGVPVDISLGIPGYEEEVWAHSIEVEFHPFGKLRLISAEDLIIHKCVAGRARDVEDVVSILVKQQLKIDKEYIKSWLHSFREVVEEHDPLELFESALKKAQTLLKQEKNQ
jgi:predicted nucleotidyltransferase